MKVVQSNMPQGTGVADTTDSGWSYVRAAIPTNGVAYITGQPAAPQLSAQFKDMPAWLRVWWSMELVSERDERGTLDDRSLPETELNGGDTYYITQELLNETVGGRCTLHVRVEDGEDVQYPFCIRGKNPLDATARAYITANVDAEFQPYAWMIAKHESKSGSRVYNQFNPSGNKAELPNWGAPHGWGIAQIDRGENGDTTAEVYDWHENVAAMNATLRDKRAEYRSFISMYRAVYANDTSTQWLEPDAITTNINGVVVSAEMWGILNCYNGKSGIPALPLGNGTDMQSPLKFDPVTTNWIFYTNINDYVPRVTADHNQSEQE